jgi:hypothetical protein
MKFGQDIVLFKKYVGLLLCSTLALLTQTSCQKYSSKAIIVIAVDSLSVGDISCTQRPASRSGFTVLCEESIRFTHAYTPSTLSAPALASLMTGLYPFQHKLHHNGVPGLNASLQTLAEAGIENGYRTAFFSGGPPVFKKTGLNQGFEIFDDNFSPSMQSLFKPFKKNIESFEKWLDQEVGSSPFIAVFYVPDLSFLETKTISSGGETRSQSFESQLEELDAQLLNLIRRLRKKEIWRDAVFVFTGLQGRSNVDRKNEIPPLNLHVENTQVPLFMKPPQKVRDSMLHWTVDRNVSLSDVGTTLYDIIGAPIPMAHASFPVFSLKKALIEIDALPPENRSILIESGWASWKKLGPLRVAALNDKEYLLFDQKPKHYNLLTDRFELNPHPPTEYGDSVVQKMLMDLETAGFEKFYFYELFNIEKFSIPYLSWVETSQATALHNSLMQLYEAYPKDLDLSHWLAASALEVNDTKSLNGLADKRKDSLWSYGSKTDPCWSLANQTPLDNQNFKSCGDSSFRDLMAWLKTDIKDSSKEWMRLRFAKTYQNLLIDRRIYKTNKALHEIWDVSPDLQWRPTYTDIYFSRPENQILKNSVLKTTTLSEEEI